MLEPKVHSSQMPIAIKNSKLDISSEETTKELAKQLSNYLKVPINYFFEDFSEYLVNLEKSQEGHMNVNYNFLVKLYSELNADQKLKFNKSLQVSSSNISKVG